MIQARFHPSAGLNAGDLLRAARSVLAKACAEADALSTSTRRALAARIRIARKRLRSKAAKDLESRRSALELELGLEAERRYREAVAGAERDCLEIALAVSREVIGRSIRRDSVVIASKVRAALETHVTGRALRITAGSAVFRQAEGGLKKEGIMIPVSEDSGLPAEHLRIDTASGSVTISWIEQHGEIARRLRALLESRLSRAAR